VKRPTGCDRDCSSVCGTYGLVTLVNNRSGRRFESNQELLSI
jgi:hypothetical protein